MSFWNNPGASFEGLTNDPWHSLENFGTTGLVPLIPYATGIVGGIYGGPAGAKAGGAAGQAGVDYFSGNSDARTGKGITDSIFMGAGKGGLAYGGYDSLGGGADIGGAPTDSSSGFDLGKLTGYGSKLASLLKLGGNSGTSNSDVSGTNLGGMTGQKASFTSIPIVKGQPAYYFQQKDEPVQDNKDIELTALIEALRNSNG
jgi:hypothetical protein